MSESPSSTSENVTIGRVTALIGRRGGKYPSGNSVLVDDDISVLIDPSITIAADPAAVAGRGIDIVVNTHAHEDHFAGNPQFPEADLILHEDDAPAMASMDALLASYGMSAEVSDSWRGDLLETFHFEPRTDIRTVREGDVLDLGHSTIRFLHTPGHTPGHMCLLIEPEDVLVLGDWDLTRFGPYYGDARASLEETISSLERIRDFDGVRAFISFHEAGVIREDLRGHVERYMDVLWQRERALIEYVSEPRTLDEIAEQCIVYRKRYEKVYWQHDVERRMMAMHAERLAGSGAVIIEEETVRSR